MLSTWKGWSWKEADLLQISNWEGGGREPNVNVKWRHPYLFLKMYFRKILFACRISMRAWGQVKCLLKSPNNNCCLSKSRCCINSNYFQELANQKWALEELIEKQQLIVCEISPLKLHPRFTTLRMRQNHLTAALIPTCSVGACHFWSALFKVSKTVLITREDGAYL